MGGGGYLQRGVTRCVCGGGRVPAERTPVLASHLTDDGKDT